MKGQKSLEGQQNFRVQASEVGRHSEDNNKMSGCKVLYSVVLSVQVFGVWETIRDLLVRHCVLSATTFTSLIAQLGLLTVLGFGHSNEKIVSIVNEPEYHPYAQWQPLEVGET